MKNTNVDLRLAPSITKTASEQTYYTIRYLVDSERVADAYRAYAYFRWVDDCLDAPSPVLTHLHCIRSAVQVSCPKASGGVRRTLSNPVDEAPERTAFLERQKSILEECYRGESPCDADIHERMLVELVQKDTEQNSGLQCYLRNMMGVMDFDVKRRDKLISQRELNEYTRLLASAVTEAMHYFIGHDYHSPHDESRYLAVTAAHITHMLRDTFDDVQAGYYNIPSEVLVANRMRPGDVNHDAYCSWVKSRVELARSYFKAGREYLHQVENPRCRLAGFAYAARFEWLLDTFEKEGYLLRPQYAERKSIGTGLRMMLSAFSSMLPVRGVQLPNKKVTAHQT